MKKVTDHEILRFLANNVDLITNPKPGCIEISVLGVDYPNFSIQATRPTQVEALKEAVKRAMLHDL